MFKVTTEPKFTHRVAVQVPIDGGYVAQDFRVTFRVVDGDKLRSDDGDEIVTQESVIEEQKEALRRIIIEMHDLVGEDDQPVPYSDALREQLIALPYMRLALNTAYIAAMTKARAGN